MKQNSVFLPIRKRFTDIEGDNKRLVDVKEIMAYTGDTADVAHQKALTCRQDLADEWTKKNPQTPEECKEFYRTTKGYLYDLYTWDHGPPIWELFDKAIKGDERVLDYGAGIGDISIYLAEKGCDVVAADIDDSATKHFMMWRVAHRKLGDKIKFKFDDKKDSFDVVLAIDVLEHLHFPLRYVVQLGSLLKNRESWAFFTPTFRDDHGVHPMHLKENYWLEKKFHLAMQSLAFGPRFVLEKYYPIWHPLFKTTAQKV